MTENLFTEEEISDKKEPQKKMDMTKLKRLIELNQKYHDFKDKFEKITTERLQAQREALEEMASAGVDQIKIDGNTVFVHSQVWAKIPSRIAAIRALKAEGLTELIDEKYNTHSISAWLRERIKSGEDLPDTFKGTIEANEVLNAKVRRG
jgi:hypothetical protein